MVSPVAEVSHDTTEAHQDPIEAPEGAAEVHQDTTEVQQGATSPRNITESDSEAT